MELVIPCPACGGRIPVEPRDLEPQQPIQCPWCLREVAVSRGAEALPAEPAD